MRFFFRNNSRNGDSFCPRSLRVHFSISHQRTELLRAIHQCWELPMWTFEPSIQLCLILVRTWYSFINKYHLIIFFSIILLYSLYFFFFFFFCSGKNIQFNSTASFSCIQHNIKALQFDRMNGIELCLLKRRKAVAQVLWVT